MPPAMGKSIDIYLECGSKRTFAAAVDWPGWCRKGPTEAEAIAALLAYGSKYSSIITGKRLGFVAPKRVEQIAIVERLPGTATTDFGAISVAPSADSERSCEPKEVKRYETILNAGWLAFDKMVESARGKTLTVGPRGGGRSLDKIVAHVIGADTGHLAGVGWKAVPVGHFNQLELIRNAILAALKASASGEIPAKGPRGGLRWTARYFVRRVAWHLFAHTWEIERRLVE